jgi:hypothetical protein
MGAERLVSFIVLVEELLDRFHQERLLPGSFASLHE